MAQFFGFEIRRSNQEKEDAPSIVIPEADDGALALAAGPGGYGQSLDIEGQVKNEGELVTRYRKMAMHPDVDSAIDDIVNEVIVTSEEEPLSINLDDVKVGESVKKKITEEFNSILNILNFQHDGYDKFRKCILMVVLIIMLLLIVRTYKMVSKNYDTLIPAKFVRSKRPRRRKTKRLVSL